MRAYVAFVRAGIALDSIWTSLNSQVFLGSEGFVEEAKARLPEDQDLSEVPRAQHRPKAKPLIEYAASGNRNKAMAEAYRSGDYTMKEIAAAFGVHYATVSRAVRACKT